MTPEPADPPTPLRDALARDRTVLANERTLLAYVRTALALFGGSVGLVQFFDLHWAETLGWVLLPTGPILMLWGFWRFMRVRRHLARFR